MMLKIILYAYMNNIYSLPQDREKAVQRDIHYIWLAAQERPDFVTINRFRNRVKSKSTISSHRRCLCLPSVDSSPSIEYIDGTKIESKANKYTFVWRKTVEKNRAKLQEKIRVLLAR